MNTFLKYFDFNKRDSFLLLFVLSLINSILFSQHFGSSQRSVDVSVVLANINLYSQEDFIAQWSTGLWSSIHQLGAIGLKYNFSHYQISALINFLKIISTVFGLSLILYSLTKSIFLSVIGSLLLSTNTYFPSLVSNYQFVDLNGPHLAGLGQSLFFLGIGLTFVNRHGSSIFVGFLSLTIHPFYGIWTLFFSFLNIFLKILASSKINYFTLFIYFFFGTAITAISFYYYFSLMLPKLELNNIYLDAYNNYWDAHRCSTTNASKACFTKWKSIYFTLFFLLAIFFTRIFVLKNNFFKEKSSYIICFISTLLAVLIYLFGEVVSSGIIHNILVTIIHGRFMVFSSILISILLISSIYDWFYEARNHYSLIGQSLIIVAMFIGIAMLRSSSIPFQQILDPGFNGLALRVSLISIFIIFPILNFIILKGGNKITYLSITIILVLFLFSKNQSLNYTKNFDYCIDEVISKPVLTASESLFFKMVRDCNTPALIDISSLDGVPYAPWTAESLGRTAEEIFGVNFLNPPEGSRNNPSIQNNFRGLWETRTQKEWKYLGKKFNFSKIVVPKEWKLNLNLNTKFKDDNKYNFSIYDIN